MEAFISTDVTKIDGTLRPFDQSLAALSVFRICKLRPFQKRVMYELVRRRDLFNDNDFLRYTPQKQTKIVLDPQQYPDGLCDSIIASLYLAREKLTVFWMDGGFWVPHQVPSSNGLPCSMPALQWNALYHENISKNYVFDPVLGIKKLVESSKAWEDPSKQCCAGCLEMIRIFWFRKRRELWEKLDGWFGLVDNDKISDVVPSQSGTAG